MDVDAAVPVFIPEGTPMDGARALISQEIELQQDDCRKSLLRNYLNAFTATATLPPEILLKIFIRFMDKSSNWSVTEKHIALTQVCQLWRLLALAAPKLWCMISNRSYSWAMAGLHRSQTASIDV